MALYAILDYDNSVQKVTKSEFNLSSINFLYRSLVKELCIVTGEKLLTSLDTTQARYRTEETINDIKMVFHIYLTTTHRYIVITDEKYPFYLITKLFTSTGDNDLKSIWKKYSNVADADKIGQVQKELDETKVIILESLQKLQIRGESLEQLVLKSDELSNSSKMFMQKSKDLNRCCIIV